MVVRDGRATGVVLDDGREISARAVISNADPKRTLLGTGRPHRARPQLSGAHPKLPLPGNHREGQPGPQRAARIPGVTAHLSSEDACRSAPGIDYLERAFDASKYGEMSSDPYLDVTIPTLHDPSLAPAGAHVMSVYVQFAPYTLAGGRSWSDAAAEPRADRHAARCRGTRRASSGSSFTSR